MDQHQKLSLWPESWQNLFECLHASKTHIAAEGNFWAAVQELEHQFGYKDEQEKAETRETADTSRPRTKTNS